MPSSALRVLLWLVFEDLSDVLTQVFCVCGLLCILFTIHLNGRLHIQHSSHVMITHSISGKQQRVMFVIFFPISVPWGVLKYIL